MSQQPTTCERISAPGRADRTEIVFHPLRFKAPFRPFLHVAVGLLFGLFGLLVVIGMLGPSSEGPVWIGVLFGMIFLTGSAWFIVQTLRRMLFSATLTIDAGSLLITERHWPRPEYSYHWQAGDIVKLQVNKEVVSRRNSEMTYSLRKSALRLRILDRRDHEYLVLEGRLIEELDWVIQVLREHQIGA